MMIARECLRAAIQVPNREQQAQQMVDSIFLDSFQVISRLILNSEWCRFLNADPWCAFVAALGEG